MQASPQGEEPVPAGTPGGFYDDLGFWRTGWFDGRSWREGFWGGDQWIPAAWDGFRWQRGARVYVADETVRPRHRRLLLLHLPEPGAAPPSTTWRSTHGIQSVCLKRSFWDGETAELTNRPAAAGFPLPPRLTAHQHPPLTPPHPHRQRPRSAGHGEPHARHARRVQRRPGALVQGVVGRPGLARRLLGRKGLGGCVVGWVPVEPWTTACAVILAHAPLALARGGQARGAGPDTPFRSVDFILQPPLHQAAMHCKPAIGLFPILARCTGRDPTLLAAQGLLRFNPIPCFIGCASLAS